MKKLSLSVPIITFNEEDNIGKTLESIALIASEIIIVDSGSTDKTLEIAGKYGACIFSEKWKGHIGQKNSAIEKCSEEWILSLDADEPVSEELRTEIFDAISNPEYDGYIINRKTFYTGRLLNHAWQPDRKLRLVRRNTNPVWKGLNPHDELHIEGKTSLLKGFIIHYSYRDIKHHFNKTVDYARQSAQSYSENGRKFHFINLLFNPPVAFIRLYIIHLGFLDGFRGLLAGFSSYVYTFLKYVFLWEAQKNKQQGFNNDK